MAQYIGEICRYILAAQGDSPVLEHKVKAMFGNGVKKQIWEKFAEKYNVKIVEFYGATEGNSNLSMYLHYPHILALRYYDLRIRI